MARLKECTEFVVFWTYGANYCNKPRRIVAVDYIDAAILSTLHDPYSIDSWGEQIKFLVFEVGGDLVHYGVLPKRTIHREFGGPCIQ